MNPNEIFDQLRTCGNLRQSDIDALLQRGVPPLALASPICLARANVTFDERAGFEFEHAGQPAIIISAIEMGRLVDLVAWIPKTGQVATWLGRVNSLGWDELFAPRQLTDEPLNVWATPYGWLRANRTGMVPINVGTWSRSMLNRGDHIPAIVTENADHGRAVHSAFDRSLPIVLTPKPELSETA